MTGEISKSLNIRPGLIATGVTVAAMLAATAWAWDKTPDNMPVHFGFDGQPDRWGPKWEALVSIPVLAAIVGAILAAIPRFDPKRENLAQSSGFYYAIWLGVLAVLAAVHAGFIALAIGVPFDMGRVICVAIGGLFVVMGNFMGKSRPNWFAGFRTPWTLSSDYSWQRTHRTVGPLFMLTGALAVGAALIFGAQIAIPIIVVGALLTATFGVALSYVFWKNDPERNV